MKKLFINPIIFISLLSGMQLFASSSTTADTVAEPMSLQATGEARPNFGENLTIILSNKNIKFSDPLMDIFKAMVAQNNNCILVSRFILEALVNATPEHKQAHQDAMATLFEVRESLRNFDGHKASSQTIIDYLIEQYKNKPQIITFKSPPEVQLDFDLYALRKIISEEGTWKLYEVSFEYYLLVPQYHFSQLSVAKRTRLSKGESLKEKGINTEHLKKVDSLDFFVNPMTVCNPILLQEVLKKIIIPKSESIAPLVIAMFGHGNDGSICQMQIPVFADFLVGLNDLNIGALAYISCHSGGRQLEAIERVACNYEIYTTIVPGSTAIGAYFNTFLLPPYNVKALLKSVYLNEKTDQYIINRNTQFAQIFDRIKKGDASLLPDALSGQSYLHLSNISGCKLPGDQKFNLGKHSLLTPLRRRGGLAYVTHTPDKIIVPDRSIIETPIELSSAPATIIPRHEQQLFSSMDISKCTMREFIEKFSKIAHKQRIVIKKLIFNESDLKNGQYEDVLIKAKAEGMGIQDFYFKKHEDQRKVYKLKLDDLDNAANQIMLVEDSQEIEDYKLSLWEATAPKLSTKRKLFA